MLHKLPKDLLVKLVETVQKDYDTYLAIEYNHGDTNVTILNSDEELKDYLRNELVYRCGRMIRRAQKCIHFNVEKYGDYSNCASCTLEELMRDISEFNSYTIMKGKVLMK